MITSGTDRKGLAFGRAGFPCAVHRGWRILAAARPLVPLALALAILPSASAGFIRTYAPHNFTLLNDTANGFATSSGELSIVLTGGNTGSGVGGWTDLYLFMPAGGFVQFDYSYYADDLPGFDSAGYLLGAAYVQLADSTGQYGTGVRLTVSEGQLFGWRVATIDNTGEPGQITIFNFSGPFVPEPDTRPALLLLAVGFFITARRRRSRPGTGESS